MAAETPMSPGMEEGEQLIFNIGDRVKTLKYGEGVVRYYGPHKAGKRGTYVGVELDDPVGRMSGKIKDAVYFACKPKHGALLLARKVEMIMQVQTYDVGDLVKVGELGPGVVEYYGPHAQKAWFMRAGVRLLEKNGVHNGTVGDHKYFECDNGYGMLVKPEKLTMMTPGFGLQSKWHQKVAIKAMKKEEEERLKEIAEQKKQEEKAAKKAAKERLASRYKPPSAGTEGMDTLHEKQEARRSSVEEAGGGDGASEIVRHDDQKEEYDIQAQYDVSSEHKGTIRRKVGSRTYLFEQQAQEEGQDVQAKSFGSMSGMYIEVATWTFWNQKSADLFIEEIKAIADDDNLPEAYFDLFRLPTNYSNELVEGEVTYLMMGCGTCQQFCEIHQQYDLAASAAGVQIEDVKKARQMQKQNGMKRLNSCVFVVKTHAELQKSADNWTSLGDQFKCKIVEMPSIGIVGGWRTIMNFTKSSTWIGCIGEFEFASVSSQKDFKKIADKVAGELVKGAKGVEKETMRGKIEPIHIDYSPSDVHVEKIGLFDASAWAKKSIQKHEKAEWCNLYIWGPGAGNPEVAAKMKKIEEDANTHCSIITAVQL